jgi:signal transduction histidine kinase
LNRAAVRLPEMVLRAELFVGIALGVTLATFGPALLLLDPELALPAIFSALQAVPIVTVLGFLFTRIRLARHRHLLRALAMGSQAIDPAEVASLSSVPAHVTAAFVGLVSATIVAAMLTPLRPAVLDFDTALSLTLLGILIVATAALPLYVAIRAAVARALELANPDAMNGVLERVEATGQAHRRLVFRLFTAIATPVGFVAFGAALIAHAHVRKFDQESRQRTAEAISRIALESSSGAVADSGRAEAIEAASRFGFLARVEEQVLKYAVVRGNDGRVSLTAPLEDGSAIIGFQVTAVAPLTLSDATIALFAVAIASVLGLLLGRSLADDLDLATRGVRRLRTEQVGPGEEPPQVLARFAQVGALNVAIETLAGRFRVFAGAQERAIEARVAAQRLRSLLFASVSHDLRSPLNAILGFTGLVRQRALSPPQRESLGFIEQSGRELLALIETILDMAKIEAGRMVLSRTQVSPGLVLAESIRNARLLASGRPFDLELELEDDLHRIEADGARLTQAITALVWYSARTADPTLSTETVRAVLRARKLGEERIAVEVHAPGTIPPEELERLLSATSGAADRRRYGGLTLGLALARELAVLHGGTLEVKRTERGSPYFEIVLSVRAPLVTGGKA